MTPRGVLYGRGPAKRAFDLVLSIPALVALSPLMVALGTAILGTMGRPILFRHERIGRDGRPFLLRKFRSMRNDAGGGLPITGGGDPRVTTLGRFLRRTKLDELPQLLNVVKGEMSIVGPRPEVGRFVALYDAEQRQILAVRPGLTDPASLAYRHEETLLGAVAEPDRERFYVHEVMPKKLALSLVYVRDASLLNDVSLVWRTLLAVAGWFRP
jgi:lipopolysaccharide/colanic/teichoic acid biosynthesis glycosyltransferase